VDVQLAIKTAHAAYTDEQWETMEPRSRTKLIYDELRRLDTIRAEQAPSTDQRQGPPKQETGSAAMMHRSGSNPPMQPQ
jgi:hypothetical protein